MCECYEVHGGNQMLDFVQCDPCAYREAFASRSIIQPDPTPGLARRWKRRSTLTPAQRDYVTAVERLAAIQKLQEQLDRIKRQL